MLMSNDRRLVVVVDTDQINKVPETTTRVYDVFLNPAIFGSPQAGLLQFCEMFEEPFLTSLAFKYLNLLIKGEIYTTVVEHNYVLLDPYETDLQEELLEEIIEISTSLRVYTEQTDSLNAEAIAVRFQEMYYTHLANFKFLEELNYHGITPVLAVVSEDSRALWITEMEVIDASQGFYRIKVKAQIHE